MQSDGIMLYEASDELTQAHGQTKDEGCGQGCEWDDIPCCENKMRKSIRFMYLSRLSRMYAPRNPRWYAAVK